MVELTEQILLSRSPTSAPAIFICLGHQLAAQAHISLLRKAVAAVAAVDELTGDQQGKALRGLQRDRKSTRLNSSHRCISYAVFCLKKKKKEKKNK